MSQEEIDREVDRIIAAMVEEARKGGAESVFIPVQVIHELKRRVRAQHG